MKKLFLISFVMVITVIGAEPRGLTSREIAVSDEVAVIQPEAVLDLPRPVPASP